MTVHEGVDLEHVAAAPPLSMRETFWLPHNAPVIGCVGALVDHKGHRFLIRAAAQVVREVPDARFVILGEGERRDELTREIRDLGLERHVLLPGFRPDVLSLLKTFDVFVMPSITEGLGTSLLDAMACARPIVASRVGGIPEVVVDGETGLLVPPRDPDSLAEAIVKLLEDRAARRAPRGRRAGARTRAVHCRPDGGPHARGLRAADACRRPCSAERARREAARLNERRRPTCVRTQAQRQPWCARLSAVSAGTDP